MNARPILFSAPMVRALLEGRKTQTRRAMKPQPVLSAAGTTWLWKDCVFTKTQPYCGVGASFARTPITSCPYGQRGDLLWVRESYGRLNDGAILYPATYDMAQRPHLKWKPSIHMPRALSRLTLEITGVRVERLQDISASDASAEGIFTPEIGYANLGERAPIIQYGRLWEEINGAGAWDKNPFVWVLEFKVHLKNIDQLLTERLAA